MIPYIGDFAPGVTLRHMWNSNDSNGASITRSTNGTISVYKDGNTTQSTTGVTDTEDFDGLTGVHLVAIDTSADGTFYSSGADFIVVLSAATIDTRTVNAALFSFSLNNRTALRPTTAGRTLDVSAGGEAGLDWANIGSPTTSVNLSGTTVKTATDVETDTQDIQSRLPAALVSGRIDASVGAMAANVLTATAINADAITAAKIADGAIDAATFAAGAINAAAIAADAITDAKVAADVTIASVTGAVGSVTGAVGSVTGNVGGNVTGSVGSIAAGGIAAASFAAGAIDATAIAADAIGASELAASAVAEIADQVWEEALADHSGTAGSTAAALNAAGAAGDPWSTALPGAYGAGTAGKIVGDNLNATVSSRATQASVDTIDDYVDTEVAAILAAVDTEIAAIKAVTDTLSLNGIADAVLRRDWTAVAAPAARSALNALRALRNKVDLASSPGDLIVTEEDDTTTAWTAALTTNAAAEPITVIDPA